MKIANDHDKQLTSQKSWDQDIFLEPWFGVASKLNRDANIFTTLWPANQGEHSYGRH